MTARERERAETEGHDNKGGREGEGGREIED